MRFVYGSYTGDGVDDRAIDASPLGGDLKWMCIQRSGQAEVMRFDLGGDLSFAGNGTAGAAGLIKSITSTGFTLGTDAKVNASGGTYYWWGLIDTGDGDIATGSYSGNATDNRNITAAGLSGTPGLVIVRGDTARSQWRSADMAGDLAGDWYAGGGANIIQSVGSGTFQLGTNAGVNSSGVTYYYLAALSVSGALSTVTYAGNATGDRAITGAGFTPDLVWEMNVTGNARWTRTASMSTSYQSFSGGTAVAIKSLISDGFTVGADDNSNGSGKTYYAVCMRSLPPSETVDMDALESALAFGEPDVTLGGITVDLEALPSALAFGEPDVQLGGLSVDMGALESGLTFGEPDVTLQPLSVDLDALASGMAFGVPGVTVGAAWQPVLPSGRIVPLALRSGRVVISQEA